jgi:hypothetical protein
MRHRNPFIVAISIVMLLVLGVPCSAVAQVTVQQPVKKPIQTLQLEVKDEAVMAATGSNEVLVLDLRGDGLDLSGRARVNVAGSVRELGWTAPDTDDAFLAVGALSIRQMGYELRWADGGRVQNEILVSDGLTLTGPDGSTRHISSPIDLLGHLDKNNDGRMDSSDPAWRYLFPVVDRNGDGKVSPNEVTSLDDSGIRSISLEVGDSEKDSHGNCVANGEFTSSKGTSRTAAVAKLRKY